MQIDMFDVLYEEYKLPKDRKVRVFESFSGIGCQRMALEKAKIDYEIVGISEIDKFALQAYEAMHGESPNLGSITDITSDMMPRNIDIFTYSYPCGDLSKAGEQKGMGEGTRSGLVYEVLRLLEEMKLDNNQPKVLIMENVVDLIQAKFIDEFNSDVQLPLEEMGYTNYVFTMNAKDYGVAQNRNRVFMVSILGEYNYNPPRPIPLEKKLKDYLEDEVEEKYYLSDKFITYATDTSDRGGGLIRANMFKPHDEESDYAYTITTRAGARASDNFIVEDDHIKIREATIKGYNEAYEGDGVYTNRPHQKRGVVQKDMIQTIKANSSDIGVVVNAKRTLTNKMLENGHLKEYDLINHSYTTSREDQLERVESVNGISATLTTRPDTLGVVVRDIPVCLNSKVDGKQPSLQDRVYDSNAVSVAVTPSFHPSYTTGLRIRKLTPTETGKLMGIPDKYLERQLAVMSNAQAYKQHGNGIVVDVFSKILENLK